MTSFGDPSRHALVLALLLVASCRENDAPSTSRDAAPVDRGGREQGPDRQDGSGSPCGQLTAGTPSSLDDAEAGAQSYASAAWQGSGVVALWERKGGQGLRMAQLGSNAALQGP